MVWNKRIVYVLVVALSIALPFFLRTDYWRDLLVLAVIFAILTLSLDIIISGMGQFSFGHHAFFAIGAYTSSLLSLHLGVPPLVGFLAASAAAGLAGLLIGYVALRSTRGIYLAIVTLGFSVILYQIIGFQGWKSITGAAYGLTEIPRPFITLPNLTEFVFRSEVSYYYLTLLILFIIIYLIRSWQHSRFGRAAASLRENEMLARSIGVSPIRVYTMTFALATTIAGLSGALYAHYIMYVTPRLFSIHYILLQLVMLFVGGVGTIGGPVLGSAIFIFVPEFIPTSQEFDFLIFGAILLAAIIFMPQGVYPTLRSLGKNLTRRLSRSRKAEKVDK